MAALLVALNPRTLTSNGRVCRCRVAPEAFGHMAALLGAVAPLAVLLEGGYNLSATAAGCEATLRVLLGGRPGRLPAPAAPSTIALLALQEVVRAQVGTLLVPPLRSVQCKGMRVPPAASCLLPLHGWRCRICAGAKTLPQVCPSPHAGFGHACIWTDGPKLDVEVGAGGGIGLTVAAPCVRVQAPYWRCLRGLVHRPAPVPATPHLSHALKRVFSGPSDDGEPSPKRRHTGSPIRQPGFQQLDAAGRSDSGSTPGRLGGAQRGPGYAHEKVVGGRPAGLGGVPGLSDPALAGASPRAGASSVMRLGGGGAGGGSHPNPSPGSAAAAAAQPLSPQRRQSSGSPHDKVARAFSGALLRSQHMAPRQQARSRRILLTK